MLTPNAANIAQSVGSQKPVGIRGGLLLTPMVLWLVLFVVIPSGILLVYSFCASGGPAQIRWEFSLEGYRQLIEASAARALWRSVMFAGITTVVCLLMGYPVAYFIGRAPEVWRNRLLVLVMIPFWTSFLIRTYAWVILLRKEGLINGALQSAHLIGAPLDILYTPMAELIGLVYSFLPFMILPIYGSVEKLDGSLIEAALDLGANPWRAFWGVIEPLTRPGIIAGVLLVFIPALGMFAISDILGGKKVPMIGNIIEQQFVGKGGDWPFGSAIGTALLAMFMAVYWLGTRKGQVTGEGR